MFPVGFKLESSLIAGIAGTFEIACRSFLRLLFGLTSSASATWSLRASPRELLKQTRDRREGLRGIGKSSLIHSTGASKNIRKAAATGHPLPLRAGGGFVCCRSGQSVAVVERFVTDPWTVAGTVHASGLLRKYVPRKYISFFMFRMHGPVSQNGRASAIFPFSE
jgi:hypothetical protein